MMDSINGGLNPAAEVEFAEQVLNVNFNGGFGKVEMACNDFIAVSCGKITQDFHLSGGKGGKCLSSLCRLGGNQAADEFGSHLGREYIIAVGSFAYAFKQEIGVDIFQQIAAGTDTHAFGKVVAVFGNGQHDDCLLRIDADDLGECLASVHTGHIKVKQDDIGLKLADHFNAGKSVGSFADDLKIMLAQQKCLDAAAEKGMVVYQNNFNGHFKLSSDAPVNETVVPCWGWE